jgi:endogenous inhibitor of DNA gyrase (YacG/DUF329 family)
MPYADRTVRLAKDRERTARRSEEHRRNREELMTERNCPNCFVSLEGIEAKTTLKRYCSDKCRKACNARQWRRDQKQKAIKALMTAARGGA